MAPADEDELATACQLPVDGGRQRCKEGRFVEGRRLVRPVSGQTNAFDAVLSRSVRKLRKFASQRCQVAGGTQIAVNQHEADPRYCRARC